MEKAMIVSLKNQTNIYYNDTFTKINSSLLIKKLYKDIIQHSTQNNTA